jgi:hypothetical protein
VTRYTLSLSVEQPEALSAEQVIAETRAGRALM